MEKSLFEQLSELANKYFQFPNLNKVDSQTYYQHKENEADRFTNPDDFITRKLNGADYEKVVILTSPKNEFFKEFFGDADYKVTKDTKTAMHTLKVVLTEAGLFSPFAISPEQANLPTPAKTKKEKTPFQKEKAAAQAKIQNVKSGANKSITLEAAQAELLAVYEKYGEVYKPRDAKTNL